MTMVIELSPTEKARFGVTIRRRNGAISIVEDHRTCIELPENTSISRIDINEGVNIQEGATGRAIVTVTTVRETTGSSGHCYVQLAVTRFVEETVDVSAPTGHSVRSPSRITMRGGERDVAGPRSVSYGTIPRNLARRKL